MRFRRGGLTGLALALSLALAPPLRAGETYDLIFRQGTLSGLPETEVLTYRREVSVPEAPDQSERGTGDVRLSFEPGDLVRLTFHQDEKHGNIGTFPADVGNPVIMYFVETVLRDVAEQTGGSPFYLRNRIKEALLLDVPVETGTADFDGAEVPVRILTLRPFEADANRDKLGAYADLALTFTLSEDVPGWYRSLAATAPGAEGGAGYSSTLTLLPQEAAQ
ncbi:MAG: hypothetical protein KDK29_04785 [Sedimentitalea sp.]|nr:hypothetical protein [Sedimentitalea sp.]